MNKAKLLKAFCLSVLCFSLLFAVPTKAAAWGFGDLGKAIKNTVKRVTNTAKYVISIPKRVAKKVYTTANNARKTVIRTAKKAVRAVVRAPKTAARVVKRAQSTARATKKKVETAVSKAKQTAINETKKAKAQYIDRNLDAYKAAVKNASDDFWDGYYADDRVQLTPQAKKLQAAQLSKKLQDTIKKMKKKTKLTLEEEKLYTHALKKLKKKGTKTALKDNAATSKAVKSSKSTATVKASKVTLKEGSSKKSSIKTLQSNLNKLGASPKLDVDGIFGPKTKAAVKEFQEKNKLKATGTADSKTNAMIASILSGGSKKAVAVGLKVNPIQGNTLTVKNGVVAHQFSATVTGTKSPVQIQVLYRKVGESAWTGFGSKADDTPTKSVQSTPNNIVTYSAGDFVDDQGWTCAMGFGKNPPKSCTDVYTSSDGKKKGVPGWAGYKLYSPTATLTPGDYEWVVRGKDVKANKTTGWSKVNKFNVKADAKTVQTDFEALKTTSVSSSDYTSLSDWAKKNGYSILFRPNGTISVTR